MYEKYNDLIKLPMIPYGSPTLPYEKPELGINYWVQDDFFLKEKQLRLPTNVITKRNGS